MLLVVTYSRPARTTLQNVCSSHEASVVRRLGRAALLRETEHGAFVACRLREKHGADVQVERTAPLNEYETVPDRVRTAAAAYEDRDSPSTPYSAFATGRDHPTADEMRDTDL